MAIRMFYSYNMVCSQGHDIIGGIDMDHAEKVVPDSLYLLI